MFGEINTLFDTALMDFTGELIGFLILCAKLGAGWWALKTLVKAVTKRGK